MPNGEDLPTIQVDGARLEYRQWPGAGVPILLLHEGLGSISMWRDFPDKLANATGRPVFAWSRRGHGSSDAQPRAHQPCYMHDEADLVPTVMTELGLDRAHLLGHSDGGSIALIAASRYPKRVASLILEAPHVMVEDLTHASIDEARHFYRTTDLPRKLAKHHADADQMFWNWNRIWLDPRFRDWNIEGILPAVRAPILLIQGENDEYGTMRQLDRIEAVVPARRLALTECGHSPHRDRSVEVLAAVTAFLRGIEPNTGPLPTVHKLHYNA